MTDPHPADHIGAPIRVGFVGLGRMGLHHLERLAARPDCRPAAAYDEIPERTQSAVRFGCRPCSSLDELLDDADVDLVSIATPPAERARPAIAALSAGKHVAVEPPLALTTDEADAVFSSARQAGRRVCLLHTRRWDGDFRTAWETVRSGELGDLRAAKLIVWDYGYPSGSPLRRPTGWRSDVAQGGGALGEFGPRYFDQLLQLTAASPVSILANLYRNGPAGAVEGPEDGFAAFVAFADGMTAHIDVNLASPVPFQTGWLLTGAAGGYKQARRYSLTAEGEVFDVPVEPSPTDWDGFYSSLLGRLAAGAPSAAGQQFEMEQAVEQAQARWVIALLQAARQSAQTGEIVDLAPAPSWLANSGFHSDYRDRSSSESIR